MKGAEFEGNTGEMPGVEKEYPMQYSRHAFEVMKQRMLMVNYPQDSDEQQRIESLRAKFAHAVSDKSGSFTIPTTRWEFSFQMTELRPPDTDPIRLHEIHFRMKMAEELTQAYMKAIGEIE